MSDPDQERKAFTLGIEEETAPELLERYRDQGDNGRPDLWRSGLDHLTKLETLATGQVWKPVGPIPLINIANRDPRLYQGTPPVSGEVTDIAIDTSGNADQILYAATNNGGIWKSTNGGVAWAPTSDSLPSLSMGAVAIDLGNPNIIYAGSGNLFDGSPGFIKAAGLYKSVDAGQTWFIADGGLFGTIFAGFDANGKASGIGINRIVCTAPDRLLVGTANGLFRSIDGGMNFGANAPNFDDGKPMIKGFVTALVMDTTNVQGAWVTISGLNASLDKFDGGGLFQLTLNPDGSVTPSLNNLLAATMAHFGVDRFGAIAFAQSANPNNQTLYVTVQDTPKDKPNKSQLIGLFSSGNLGATWTRLNNLTNLIQGTLTPDGKFEEDFQSAYDLTLGVDPQNANLVYAGFNRIWISRNGGVLFNVAGQFQVHFDQHELVFSPQSHLAGQGPQTTVYVGSDGGVARSTNGGANWAQLNSGAATHLFFGIDIGRGAGNNQITYGGMQDNGTAGHRAADAASLWVAGIDGDGGIPAVDPANPSIVYGFDDAFLIKTSDAGLHWALSSDTDGAAITNISNTVPIQVTAPGHLFQQGDKVTITGVQGNIAANRNAPWDIHVDQNNFTLDGSDGRHSGAYVPANPPDLAKGRRIGRGLANPGNSFARRVALVPNGANAAKTVYVSEAHELRKSTDGGAHFSADPIKKFDTGFPSFRELTIFSLVCPDANRVWVGTSDGKVHFSPDGGSSWVDASPGGSGPVTGIAIDPRDINHVAAVCAGFSGINPRFRTKHCFVTIDGGSNWTDISGVDGREIGNLPDLPLHSVVFDGSSPGSSSLIVGTEGAVLSTDGDLVTWKHAGAGLPRATCRSLAIDNTVPQTVLRVGTYGRSCFELTRLTGSHVVVESNLAFGGVVQGKSDTLKVRLHNVGDSATTITSFSRTDGNEGQADFDFETGPDLSDISPGVTREFGIKFTAAGNGIRTATFTLQTNDADHPAQQIFASGITFPAAGAKARLAVNTNLNFGEIDRGATRTLSFSIASTGLADLVVTKVSRSGSDEFSLPAVAVPLTLAPGAEQSFDVTFTPGTWGRSQDAKFIFESNDPRGAQSVPLRGSAPFNIGLLLVVIGAGAAVATGVAEGIIHFDDLKKLVKKL